MLYPLRPFSAGSMDASEPARDQEMLMVALPTVERELPVDATSIARLHGEACIECGATSGPLLPAGHVYTRSRAGRLGWSVVACPEHLGTES